MQPMLVNLQSTSSENSLGKTENEPKESFRKSLKPSDSAIQNILNFSKSLEINTSKSMGFFENIKN